MNRLLKLFLLLLVLSLTGCLTRMSREEYALSSKVVRIKYRARYLKDGKWQELKLGDKVPSHCVVQTSAERGAFLDLLPGELASKPSTARDKGLQFKPRGQPKAIFRLYHRTFLTIDSVSREKIHLTLSLGRLFVNVGEPPPDSLYEIAYTNGVARVFSGWCELDASGRASVMKGRTVLRLRSEQKELLGGHGFDPQTGSIFELPLFVQSHATP